MADTNNDLLSDIASESRNTKTNNQLLQIIAETGGGGLTPEQVTKLNSIDTKADLVDGKVPQSQLPTAAVGLELGETSTKAHRGDHGKTAYDHTSRQDNPHNTTRYQVGLDSQYGYAELDASGVVKLDQINVSGLSFKGAWDASTNTPELLDGTGSVGDFYKVSVAGSQDFGNGLHVFNPGDWVIFAGGVWQRIGVHEAVASVAGKTGAVTLNAADVGARPSSYVPAWSEVTDKPNFATLYSPKPRGNMSHPIPAVYAGMSSNQTLQTGVNTNIVFGTSSFDQFSMLTEDGFVVPSWASHARVTLGLVFEDNGTGARYASVTRNSTTLNPVRVVAVSGASTIAILTTPIREMPSGSVLNAMGWQNSGGDLNVTTASWIQIELFEAI